VILLLITPNFIDSRFCYENELALAMERHKTEKICVIPVLVKKVACWTQLPFAKLQVLPPGASLSMSGCLKAKVILKPLALSQRE
jgi:hypothetical protein